MKYSKNKLFTTLISVTLILGTPLSFLVNKSLAANNLHRVSFTEPLEQINSSLLSPDIVNKTNNHLELADNRRKVPREVYEVWQITNQVRAKYGLRPLQFNHRLYAAAQNHSNDMARNRFMSHRGSNGSTMSDRVKAVGYQYSYLAENVASGQRTPQEVVRSWMNSSGHRKNILNPNLTEIGIGYANNYWTQVFGRRK
ncbi:MAG: CAP domain-containing protein [Moorea sp. SIO4G2]|nr:CAP domain-containing protein [Moorena sp. SIO4G2]